MCGVVSLKAELAYRFVHKTSACLNFFLMKHKTQLTNLNDVKAN